MLFEITQQIIRLYHHYFNVKYSNDIHADGALSHYRYKDHLRTEIFAANAELPVIKESSQEHAVYSWCNTDNKISAIQSANQHITSTTKCYVTC